MLLDFIVWLVLGAIVGWVATYATQTETTESLMGADVIAGIVGSLLGGGLAYFVRAEAIIGFDLASSAAALLGAVVAVLLVHSFSGSASEERERGHRFQH